MAVLPVCRVCGYKGHWTTRRLPKTQQHHPLVTLRVSNLNAQTSESDLALLFDRFGINHIFLAKDPFTRTSQGFAFVTFEDSITAERATRLQGHTLHDRYLCVKMAKPKND